MISQQQDLAQEHVTLPVDADLAGHYLSSDHVMHACMLKT